VPAATVRQAAAGGWRRHVESSIAHVPADRKSLVTAELDR
jgi:hypothetical protein